MCVYVFVCLLVYLLLFMSSSSVCLAGMPVDETTNLVASQPSLLDLAYSDSVQSGALQRLAGALDVTIPALIVVLSRCSVRKRYASHQWLVRTLVMVSC
jgi:hypothetical protein